jgi:hypothetical protein
MTRSYPGGEGCPPPVPRVRKGTVLYPYTVPHTHVRLYIQIGRSIPPYIIFLEILENNPPAGVHESRMPVQYICCTKSIMYNI